MDTGRVELERLLLHGAWLRRFARALVRDEDVAEDVAQQTLVSAWQSPPAAGAKPRSWLARVAQNRARDLNRSDVRRRRRERETLEAIDEAATPEQLVGGMELHRQLAALVTALDEPFRQTVVLRYYEGLDAAEIAARLGMPAGTVRWRLKEGLARLRRALDAEHGGSRKKWMLALGPMVAGVPLRPRARPRLGGWTRAGLVVGLVGGASVVMSQRREDQPREVFLRAQETHGLAAKNKLVVGRAAPPRLVVGEADQENEPAATVGPAAADPDALVRYMLSALADGSYDDFLTYADNALKAHLTPDDMGSASAQFGPRLRQGYTMQSFGTLRQEEGAVHLWKIEFADGGDDQLLRVTIHEGRASSFFIQ